MPGTPGLGFDKARWGLMDTSLKCGEDRMQLKALGPGSNNFMLDNGMLNCTYNVCPVMLCIIGYFGAGCILKSAFYFR